MSPAPAAATGQPGTKGLAWPWCRQHVCPGLGCWFRLVQGGSCFQGEYASNCSFTDRKMLNRAALSLKALCHCHLFLLASDLMFQQRPGLLVYPVPCCVAGALGLSGGEKWQEPWPCCQLEFMECFRLCWHRV